MELFTAERACCRRLAKESYLSGGLLLRAFAVLLLLVFGASSPMAFGLVRAGSDDVGATVHQGTTATVAVKKPYDFASAGLGTEFTVFAVLTGECEPCEAAMPFYRKVLASKGFDGKARRFIVLVKGYSLAARDLLRAGGVKPDRMLSFPVTQYLDAPDLPTLFLIGRSGEVIKKWAGPLDAAAEKEILALLASQ